MALPVISGGFRVILAFSGGVGSRNWTTHADYIDDPGVGAGDPSDLWTALNTALHAWWADGGSSSTETRDYFTVDQALQSATIYALDGASAPQIFTPSPALIGTASAGGALPPDVALVTSLRTAVRGARARGRMYWQPRASASNANGVPFLATRTQLAQRWGALCGALVGSASEYSQVVIGRAAEGSSTLVARPVLSWSADAHFDTQRRRGLA